MIQRIVPLFQQIWLKEFNSFLKNMTQSIEPSFSICLKELNVSFFILIQRCFWICLKELNIFSYYSILFFQKIQWIELFEYDSQKWTFKRHDSNNWTFKKKSWKNWTFFEHDSQNWTFYFWIWRKDLFFFEIWFKEWNLLENMTQRIEFFPNKNMAQKNWTLFSVCLSELNPFCMTQRIDWLKKFFKSEWIELFLIWLKEELFFWFDSKNWTFFLHDSEKWLQYDAKNWTFFFLQYDAKNWTLFFEYDAKNWTLFLWIRRKELNPFSLNMTQRIEPFFFEYDAKNWTLFLWIWRKELNPFFLNMTQRIEPFFTI